MATIDGAADYMRHIVGTNEPLDGLHVVLDCANGSGSAVGPRILAASGARVETILAGGETAGGVVGTSGGHQGLAGGQL